jgi:hypothetical protein
MSDALAWTESDESWADGGKGFCCAPLVVGLAAAMNQAANTARYRIIDYSGKEPAPRERTAD